MSSGGSTPESWIDRIKAVLGMNAPASLREGLAEALALAAEAGDLSEKEAVLLTNVLKLRDVRVADLMVPRARIVGVEETETLAEVLAAFHTSGHSRLPAYRGSLDDPSGMVHLRDFLGMLAGDGSPFADWGERKDQSLGAAGLVRPLIFVPPSTPALDLMLRMQAKRLHMALVIDEYGETDGLVTMEDLIEAIVGLIDDEHDLPEPARLVRRPDGALVVAADVSLEEVEAALGLSLETDRPTFDVGSIGGLVTVLAGRVPQAGEHVDGPGGVRIDILQASPRQLLRLVVHPPARAAALPGSEAT